VYNRPIIPETIASFDEIPSSLLDELMHIQNNQNPEPNLVVNFSVADFFHSETVLVSIYSNDPNAIIYFTTDSSTPTASSNQFLEPIVLEAGENLDVIVLKAIAVNDVEESRVITQTFFVGTNVHERFSTYVVSISTDGYNLYDYYHGILVEGAIRTQFMNYGIVPSEPIRWNSQLLGSDPESVPIWWRPANYRMTGREWERPVHVEVFTQDGERVIAQNAGIRMHGGATRLYTQKSMRLTARDVYEPGITRFNHSFFEDHMNYGVISRPMTAYNTLILRNDGNDHTHARIRNPLATRIALESGFPAVSPTVGVAVFVNGIYYGYYSLLVRVSDDQFLEDLFDAPERSFQFVTGGSHTVHTHDVGLQYDFARLLEYSRLGLNDYRLQAVNDFFDIEHLLFYYAIQTYIGNSDWPLNNIRIWRYTGNLDVDNLAPELDGRWRFVMWDLDHSLNFNEESSPSARSIHRLLDGTSAPIFEALLQRQEYAEIFANYISDMAFEHFYIDNVERVLQDLNDEGLHELTYHQMFFDADYNDIERMMRRREGVLEFIRLRPYYILEELRDLFGFTDMFSIVSDGSVRINSLNGNVGVYFVENQVPVTPIIQRGYEFDHWLINGEARYEENLRISAQYADVNGIVSVQAVLRPIETSPLIFVDTFIEENLVGFSIYNSTDNHQSTHGLFLSNDIHNLSRWQFPALTIRPGATWDFAGRNSASGDAITMIALNFNPSYGDTIFLSNEEGVILDYIHMR